MSSITALPAATGASHSAGLARLRQMLASDVGAVTPIRRIPGEQDRRRLPELDGVEDAIQASRKAGLDEKGLNEAGRRRSQGAGTVPRFSAEGSGHGPVGPGLIPLTATPSAGFVAQSIHQEAMGSGLHIEPWPAAIQAYRSADAGAGSAMLTRFAV